MYKNIKVTFLSKFSRSIAGIKQEEIKEKKDFKL